MAVGFDLSPAVDLFHGYGRAGRVLALDSDLGDVYTGLGMKPDGGQE